MAGAAGSRTAGAVTPEGRRLKKWSEERAQVRLEKREAELRRARADRSDRRLTGGSAAMTATPLLDRGLNGAGHTHT